MEINVSNEAEFISATLDNQGPVVVLFTAPTWCQPCRQFEPHWTKAHDSEALKGYTFIKVDMGESPSDTGLHWASHKFNIMSVPQVKIHRGEVVSNSHVKMRNMSEWEDIKSRAVVPLIKEIKGV